MIRIVKLFIFILPFLMVSCQDSTQKGKTNISSNLIKYAKGLAIYKYEGYSIIKVSNPWPNAKSDYSYVLKENGATIPDSLAELATINVPVKKIVVTSTTHIPSLEMLGVENTLKGFPNLSYISSEKVRAMIESDKILELGANQSLNTEVIIELQPDVIVGFGIDNNNPTLDNLAKNGLPIMLNGDWNEQSPLGKAEWIKFFGALYQLDSKADAIFTTIEKEYNETLKLAKKTTTRPTVISGAVFESKWYLPQGNSWGALCLKDAGGKYLWEESTGTGSLSLSFETVFEKGMNADFWIGPGQYTSLQEMASSNPHYTQFKSYKSKNVYSFSSKKGKTGGVIYYELAPNRPDLVLKDMVKILHPELLPDYSLYFFEKLK